MKKYFKFEPNAACAIFGSKDATNTLGFLPNTHTEVISFITAFFYSKWHKYTFDLIPFVFLSLMLLLTAWSRISIGCKQLKDVFFNIVVGSIRYAFLLFRKKTLYESRRGRLKELDKLFVI